MIDPGSMRVIARYAATQGRMVFVAVVVRRRRRDIQRLDPQTGDEPTDPG